MRFVQHIDPVIKDELFRMSGIRPFEFEFNDIAEFLANSVIQFFTNDENFNKFSIYRGEELEVIVELKDGREFKLGVTDGEIPGMPDWVPPELREVH